ncbi:SCP2 sterol-binding domain-containing protein [Actinocrispum wychmicini]|uniref:SCP-2 sterol transfer family protein n=1 Tax=Actinocrispum wychmicini TaxID=1213861 RepID=A0A4R2JPH5_9PSEU|nr:SCP2 sterol-binding domain-containing protein [Actinocrispum wychmicini]TCO62063.1 SCP-2 sterol transfer family protein [Actinocrispum wychmicini]
MNDIATHYGQIAKIVDSNPVEDLPAVLTAEAGGTDAVLDTVFAVWVQRIDPARTGDMDADIQFDIGTEEGVKSYVMALRPNSCEGRRGSVDAPLSTITVGLTDFLLLVTGNVTGASLGMTNRMRTSGDTSVVIKMKNWFAAP